MYAVILILPPDKTHRSVLWLGGKCGPQTVGDEKAQHNTITKQDVKTTVLVV